MSSHSIVEPGVPLRQSIKRTTTLLSCAIDRPREHANNLRILHDTRVRKRALATRVVTSQFHRWHENCAPHVPNPVDAIIAKDGQCPFVGYSYWPRRATLEYNRAHYCLVDPALCAHRYLTSRPKTGLQASECGTGKINSASDLLGALAVCDGHV